MPKHKNKNEEKTTAIANKIIKLIEQGVKPWVRPWNALACQNILTGKPYSGINPTLCNVDIILNDWEYPLFVGFNQAKQKGWSIKKGSKATAIRFGGAVSKEVATESGEKTTQFYNVHKWMNVFNVACIDDSNATIKVQDLIDQSIESIPNTEPRLEAIDKLVEKHGVCVKHGGQMAFYSPSTDTVHLPNYEDFSGANGYYATLLHELTHWTGHEKRCNRPLSNQFGSVAYGFEELIAELGATTLCDRFGLTNDLENHSAYIKNWLNLFEQDPKALFKAANYSTKAIEFLIPEHSNDIASN